MKTRLKLRLGRLPFDEKFLFGFPEVSSDVWNNIFFGISGKGDNLVRILVPFDFISVEWFDFRKFNNYRNFWLNGKRPFRPFSNPWDTSPGPRLFHILHYKSTRFGWNLWFQSCNYLNQEIWRLELNWIPLSFTLNS